LRIISADSGRAGTFDIAVTQSLFSGSGFLCPDCALSDGTVSNHQDKTSVSTSRLALSVTPTRFFEAFTSAYFKSLSNDQNVPTVMQTGGSANLGAKFFTPYQPGRLWSLAGVSNVSLLAKNRSIGSATVNLDIAAIGTLDFRELRKNLGIPLRLHLNGMYRIDNSGDVAKDIEARRSDHVGRSQHVTRIDRLGFDIRRTDILRFGFAVEGAFAHVRPFGEWSIDVPINRQGYECQLGFVGPGDSCLSRARYFASLPSRLTLGVRAMPFKRSELAGVGFLLGVDVATGGSSHFVDEMIPELPWTVHLGLSYTVAPVSPVVTVPKIEPKPVVVPEPPPEAYVTGRVVEKAGIDGAVLPVAQASISFKERAEQGMIAGDDGRFHTSELLPGHYVFHVTKNGFIDTDCAVNVSAPSLSERGAPTSKRTRVPTEIVCEMTRLPTTGIVSGVLRDADTTVFVPYAVVSVFDSRGRKISLKSDEFGGFRIEKVPEGTVRVQVEADGYLMNVSELQLKARENVSLPLSIHKRPKTASVNVTSKELKLKRPIQFLFDSAELLSDSQILIEEVAEVLRSRPEIGPIEIQSHLDDTFTPERAAILSEKRANAIRQQLVRLGIGPDRLIAKGFGSNQPLFPNTNKVNRAKNQRMMLLIQK
jgi:outer membrane protein OmpA-like peptidoglycan-associated protein